MLVPNNNLVTIAYKTGYCGTLVYNILALSPEVQPYQPINKISFDDGTAHANSEYWFNGLHDYDDSLSISESDWESYQTTESRWALSEKKLVTFRCHPNIAMKLSFIENLKIIYLTHANKYIPERWAYEKIYKPQGDKYFQNDLKKILKTTKTIPINDIIKRDILIRNLNHDVVPIENFLKNCFEFKIELLLSKDYQHYLGLCEFLEITPINNNDLTSIIDYYNSKQWKRF